MKRILTINCTSDNGSISKIIKDIEKSNSEYEYFHCYQIGPKSKNIHEYLVESWFWTKVYYAISRVIGIKYGLGIIPTRNLFKHIKNIKPDLIHIHCPNFYTINLYKLFSWLKKSKIPVVITNHAEFFYTGNCAYSLECIGFLSGCRRCKRQFDSVHPYLLNRTHYEWKRMKASFSDAKNFTMTVVSPWQAERIKLSPVIPVTIPVKTVLNGLDTSVFKLIEEDKIKIRRKLGIDEKSFTVLQVTSSFTDKQWDLKGGWYLIQLAVQLPDIKFIVAGNYNISDNTKLPTNIILLGSISNQNELAMYYNAADVTVLTSKKETFGMACAESLCCGTPVVAFYAGGTESIAIKDFCDFIEFGDVGKLAEIVRIKKRILDENKDNYEYFRRNISASASIIYDSHRMGIEYGNIYKNLL